MSDIYTAERVNDIVEQYRTAPPDTQGSWEHRLALTAQALYERLQEANQLLRSACHVAMRERDRPRETTNWKALHASLATELREQHRLMHPELYPDEPDPNMPPRPADPPPSFRFGVDAIYKPKSRFTHSGLCSAHQHGEDADCPICYPAKGAKE